MVEISEIGRDAALQRTLNADYERAADFLFATPGATNAFASHHHNNGRVYGPTFEKTAPDRASLIDRMKHGEPRGFNIYCNFRYRWTKQPRKKSEGLVSTVYALHGDFDASSFTYRRHHLCAGEGASTVRKIGAAHLYDTRRTKVRMTRDAQKSAPGRGTTFAAVEVLLAIGAATPKTGQRQWTIY